MRGGASSRSSSVTRASRVPRSFTIAPRGPFSLAAASSFGFGQRDASPDDDVMRLAFAVDGFREHAGVIVRQIDDGVVHCEVEGAGELEAVRRQVERVLSLDHDGEAWLEVGRRDPVIGRLQQEHPGQRPGLFYSPYEAAVWSVISSRRPQRQAARVRQRVSEELGASFELAGERLAAFPLPDRLLEQGPIPGLPPEKVDRLHGIARAALAGELDPDLLRSLGPEGAAEEVRKLRGIGPFYSELIAVRAIGFADALPANEPRVLAYASHFYGVAPLGPDGLRELAEQWRPFRTWAIVLLRLAGDRAGLVA